MMKIWQIEWQKQKVSDSSAGSESKTDFCFKLSLQGEWNAWGQTISANSSFHLDFVFFFLNLKIFFVEQSTTFEWKEIPTYEFFFVCVWYSKFLLKLFGFASQL